MSEILETMQSILINTLQLTMPQDSLTADFKLLGSVPELDSMAVVSLITAIEEHYDFIVDDDEINADTFENVGTLVNFIQQKLNQ